PTQKDQHGGIKEEERPLSISNLMIICTSCKKRVKSGVKFLENQEKVRICKKCKAILDK
ncbi:MAG: 50S ribosomal protein L24, partial [uncultured bacterium]